jgi:hypothetical protein
MWHNLGVAALFGALGMVLSFIGYKVFDWVETGIDFVEEIKKRKLGSRCGHRGIPSRYLLHHRASLGRVKGVCAPAI